MMLLGQRRRGLDRLAARAYCISDCVVEHVDRESNGWVRAGKGAESGEPKHSASSPTPELESNVPFSLDSPQVVHPVSLSPHHYGQHPRRVPSRPGHPRLEALPLPHCHSLSANQIIITYTEKGEASSKCPPSSVEHCRGVA